MGHYTSCSIVRELTSAKGVKVLLCSGLQVGSLQRGWELFLRLKGRHIVSVVMVDKEIP